MELKLYLGPRRELKLLLQVWFGEPEKGGGLKPTFTSATGVPPEGTAETRRSSVSFKLLKVGSVLQEQLEEASNRKPLTSSLVAELRAEVPQIPEEKPI